MATHLAYDTDKRIVYVTTAPVAGVLTLDVRQNIYSDMKKDWKENAALNKHKFPLSEPVGGNVIVPGEKYVSPYYFLKYNWTMRPYEADHTLYLENAYLLLDGGGEPWNPTLGGYTVNVRDSIPADAFALVQAGADPDTIAAAVWAYMINSLRSAGEELEFVTQLVQDVPKEVWDRVLSGATHNIPSSAGRRLRELGDVISGSVVADSGNSLSQFVTNLTESRDDFYNDQLIRFTSGNLEGYAAPILDYDGTNKIVTVDEPMVDIPDDGIDFNIVPMHIHPITQVVDGLWNAVAADYLTVDTFGEMVNNLMWITGNKVTKSGDIITIYEPNGITVWRQYDTADDERIPV